MAAGEAWLSAGSWIRLVNYVQFCSFFFTNFSHFSLIERKLVKAGVTLTDKF